MVDRPRIPPGVALRDVIFRSAALNRDMHYRVLLPAKLGNVPLPVAYLLHGGGGTLYDWTNYSDVAVNARQMVLVLPDGDESYYTNSATRPEDRFEDYVVQDVVADVESRFPVLARRESRAIIGVSMGGYGAVKIALRHPSLFAFAGGVSSALDVPRRAFSWKRIGQWRHHSSIFGSINSDTRKSNDPFVLVQRADPRDTPYLYLTCGEQEGLLPANKAFAAKLKDRGVRFEFHTRPGGHDWEQWNEQLPGLLTALRSRLQPELAPTR